MDRRRFIVGSALAGSAASGLAAPALAQSRGRVSWRCASGFPASLETVHGAALVLAEAVGAATDGRFEITVLDEDAAVAAGDGALDAVQSGSVEMLHTAPHYFAGRDPAFAFGSGLPFGLNQRLTDAWLHEGGGLDLMNTFFAGHNVVGLPAGNTGAQMGGWFNKEINSLDDLAGVRFRIGGFGSRIISEIGVVPHALEPGNIVAALEAQEIDAAEFAGPADDIALGLHRAARYLYYPGWWEGGIALMAMINRDSWGALTPEYQAILRNAAALANMRTMARYDILNPAAMQELETVGTIVRPYSNDIMDACFAASEQVYRDISDENETFATMLDSYMAYRRTGYAWLRRADYAYDTFLMILERGGRL
ncbi:TRAP transporter substrate-binding protein [Pararhizobium haloflavum]|uniref:TRAP transporter substrate-binding protein n=1 Tax=Pararhizobium haloflavum TaxID=2037914 RepID=UPI000C193C4C|nr:ABC transporter substrate-binding protein [Pararhizobium haloflavum]